MEAGADQEVAEGTTVSLSGTASDSDNDPLTYMWTHDSALSITLADDTAISTTFTAPAVTQDTTIIFTLAVSDDADSVTDTVSVTITDTTSSNSPPTVEAGADQEVAEGTTVSLSGTASDSDNDPLTYMWTHDSALSITLADDTAISTTFTAPAVTQDTTIIFTLAVSDDADSVTDTVSVTITDTTSSNSPPTVEAGPDQTVDEGDAVTLSGTASDSDNDPLTYMWTHDSALSITLADDTAISTTFTAPAVTQDTTIIFTLAVSDDADSVTDTVSVTITDTTSSNSPPTVEAGPDQTVDEGDAVTLSGTASDSDNDPLTYMWTHDSALSITLADDTAISTTFTAPAVTQDTTIIFTLAVSDDADSVTDTVSVTITDTTSSNSPPTVEAGPDQTVDEGDAVTLSGTASDSDNDPLTYMWTHDSALSITLADDTAISTTFTAPAVTQDTTIIFTLAVSDDADSVTDTVSVTITDTTSSNSPPTVEAGPDQTVDEGDAVTLSGTASDSDNDPLTYMWTHDSALSITLADDTAISTTFTAPAVTQDTTIIFTLAVSDDADSVTDTVSVTITDTTSSNSPPTVEAGPDQTVDEGDAVTLSGTASDSDNDPLTYMWTHDSALSITLADDTAISTTFTAPAVTQDTTIIFTLAVSDDANSVTDTVSVTITNNTPPTVEAGPDQTVDEGATVTLSGTVSDDDPEDALTYEWTHDSALAIAITGSDSASASFAAPDVAANTTITVTLTVNDGTVEVSDALQVTITDSPSIPPAADAGLNLTAAGGITDTGTLKLLGARGIAIFESGSSTYAAVIAYFDNGVQVLDVTDPSAITAAGGISDTDDLKLAGASGIAVFESGGSTYAAVASSGDNGVQILDVTDPSAITATDNIGDNRRPRAARRIGHRHVRVRRQHLRGGRLIRRQRRPDT